ncbi:hypothetical protein GCM10025734_15140 [Kitasatospora paranensis]|uniref:AMP-binding protein n=1 Tax=Kitasatospora paranensis TaxID=258053 RepID=UPI0031EB5AB2
MSAAEFALPGAWRHTGPDAAAVRRVEVPYADLAAQLQALAADAGADPSAALAAAHVKVLGTLTEERVFGTDVLADDGSRDVRRLTAEPAAARSWRELVGQVAQALRSTAPAAARADGPRQPADRALLAVGTAALAPSDGASGPGRTYGLAVGAADGVLVLQSGGHLGAADLERLATMYRGVLEAMAKTPDGDAATNVLPDGERHAVLHRWAVGPSAGPEAGGVLDLFRDQAARTPDAPAVRVGGHTLDYRELDRRSTRIARHLLARGARPEVPVGVCLRRGPDLLPTLLGVWKSGAPYLPLDADLPAPRLRHMAAAAGCTLVVTRSEHLSLLGDPDRAEPVLLDAERAAIDALPHTPSTSRSARRSWPT